MKTRALVLGLSLLSASTFANNYVNQVDFDYATVDSADIIMLNATHYFDQVTTNGTAWAEAAYMGKNNNVAATYSYLDGDANALTLRGEYYSDNNFFGAIQANYVDVDNGGSDTSFSAEVGYFFKKNWLVAIQGNDEDFSDTLSIRTKYIASLESGAFANLEAIYSDATEDTVISGDYYWVAQSSIGATLSDADGYNFGLQAQHFFTPTIAARVSYVSLDADDLFSVGISGRF